MANKIRYGFRNVVYAPITEEDGIISYGTVGKLAGGVNVALAPSGEQTTFYADDSPYFVVTANNGYEGTIELAELSQEFKVDILGYTLDSNNALIENADAIPKNFALGFEVQGDEKARRTWYYYCSVARPNDDANTKEANITPQTSTLNLNAMPRPTDKRVKATMYAGGTGYDTFFNSVYEG